MTAPVATSPPARVAARVSVCGAPGCHRPIEPGMRIVKPPGRAWRHADCTAPRRGRNSLPYTDLDRLMRSRSSLRPLPVPPPLHVIARHRGDLVGVKPPSERSTR
jgi:hypothetical protein